MTSVISEDCIAGWILAQGGILHTRKISNIIEKDISAYNAGTLVCLTGYDYIIENFFNNIISQFSFPIILITIESDVCKVSDH